MKTQGEIKGEVETITPEYASELLERHNPLNRKINQSFVDFLIDCINDGRWKINGEPIIISDKGNVLDGQHRLWAINMSGRPVQTYVVRGIDESTFDTINTGRSRSAADVLTIYGKRDTDFDAKYAGPVAAAALICLEYLAGTLRNRSSRSKISKAEILEYTKANPGLAMWIEKAKRFRKNQFTQRYTPRIAMICYLGSHRHPAKAESFMHGFFTADMISIRSPIMVLRNRLETDKVRLHKWEGIALKILAWNLHVADEERTILKLPSNGEMPVIAGTEKRSQRQEMDYIMKG